ncbi:VOC family protein [Bradyrhizobium sp. LHD-71]|uniref:VOC family protein n=1 Tax=Bradyrhizobium sp. LHD-71 TaxID=3072141 RepID=UPI00280EE148|nr:VOC family protein [Bradyrhizobium sp. LHD-71]MDQ8730597.1 VOC family protein [Bradyrhizobium sp. LHD-71]
MAEPNNMPPITPYLTIKGANEAIEFYKKAFGAKENARLPYEDGKRLMHAEISMYGGTVLLSDEFPEHGQVMGPTTPHSSPVAVALHFKTPAELDAAFKRAAEAGVKTEMEPTDMFWGGRFAALLDPFNHRWLMHAPLPPK